MDTFALTIQQRTDDGWPVVAEVLPESGPAPIRHDGSLQLDPSALTPLLLDPQGYGCCLGRALFQGDVETAFARVLTDGHGQVRVLLTVEDDQLKPLRWERLCAPFDGDWCPLALDQRTPFSLYLAREVDFRFPAVSPRDLNALGVVANPRGLADYRLEPFDEVAVLAGLRAAFDGMPCDVLAVGDGTVGPPTLDALCAQLTAKPYAILHVVCHGAMIEEDQGVAVSSETVLYLADDENGVAPVPGAVLIERLARLGGDPGLPSLAFLSACESASRTFGAAGAFGGLAERLVRELGMPAVVAMTDRVAVTTASELAAGFYRQLRQHGQVDLALVEARAGLGAETDVTVPALFSRLGERPLFSTVLERPLTTEEIRRGLATFRDAIAQRAPILSGELARQTTVIEHPAPDRQAVATTSARTPRELALLAVNTLALETLDVGFDSLALGEPLPPFDERCPFRGLEPFYQEDRAFFFGRGRLVAQLVDRLDRHPFLAILGPSGSGKSSLVYAGLIPCLAEVSPDFKVAILRPGADPVAQLDAALAQPLAGTDLVFVDQFEEVFTLCGDEARRRAFIARLLTLAESRRVVLTMRADFWGDCAPYAALRQEMQTNQELIAPMTAFELRRAMEQQARSVGVQFEAGLAARILDDVQGEPGAMPLLQHALRELWLRRHGRWLRAAEYDAIGGVRGALAKTADTIVDGLTPSDRTRLRAILIRLTQLDETGAATGERRDTRRRVPLAELTPLGEEPDLTRALVNRMADARLLVTSTDDRDGEEVVEIAHEALIRSWPRLRRWLDEDRASLLLLTELRTAANQWNTDGYVTHRDERIAEIRTLERRSPVALNELEVAYIGACVKRQRRQQRVRNGFLIGLAAFAAVAAVAAVMAFRSLRREQEQQAQTLAAVAQGLATHAHRQADAGEYDLAALLAVQAVGFDRRSGGRASNDVEQTLRDIAGDPRFPTLVGQEVGPLTTVAVDPQGTYLITGDKDAKIKRVDLSRRPAVAADLLAMGTPSPLTTVSIAADSGLSTKTEAEGASLSVVRRVAVGQSGELVAAHDANGYLWLIYPDRAGTTPSAIDFPTMISAIAADPRSDTVAVATTDGDLFLVAAETRTVRWGPNRSSSRAPVNAIAFAADGSLLAVGANDGSVTVWQRDGSSEGWTLLNTLRESEEWVSSVAFGPDAATGLVIGYRNGVMTTGDAGGTNRSSIELLLANNADSIAATRRGETTVIAAVIATVTGDHRLVILAGSTMKATILATSRAAMTNLAFAADGRFLAWGTEAGEIRRWETDALEPPRVNADGVQSMAFDPNGRLLATAGRQAMELWDVSLPVPRRFRRFAHDDADPAVAWDDRGALVAYSDAPRRVVLWDIKADAARATVSLSDECSIGSLAVVRGGDRVAVGCREGSIVVWDADRADQTRARLTLSDSVSLLAFGGDGNVLAAGKPLVVAEVDGGSSDGRPLVDAADPGARVTAIRFSPDGSTLASGYADGSVRVWRLAGGSRTLVATARSVTADRVAALAFSRSGTTLVWGSAQGEIDLWGWTGGTATPIAVTGSPAAWREPFVADGDTLSEIATIATTGDEEETIVAVDLSGTVWRLAISASSVRQQACAKAGRELAQEEWEIYVGSAFKRTSGCGS